MKTADITIHLESPWLDWLEHLANLQGKSVADLVTQCVKIQAGSHPEYSPEAALEKSELPETKFPPRPDNLTPEEAAEWDYYTSPEAMALYARVAAKYPASDSVRSLRGIATGLSPEDLKKTAKEWRAEAIEAKYGA